MTTGSARPAPVAARPRQPPIRDRAMLRILNRSKTATCRQLGELNRTRLRRSSSAPSCCGKRATSNAGARPAIGRRCPTRTDSPHPPARLGYHAAAWPVTSLPHPRRGRSRLRARPSLPTRPLPAACLADRVDRRRRAGTHAAADSVLVLRLTTAPACCLETDEATSISPSSATSSSPTGSTRRALGMARPVRCAVAGEAALAPATGRGSTAAAGLDDRVVGRARGAAPPRPDRVAPARGRRHAGAALSVILIDPRRRDWPSRYPGWLELLASGGGEELGGALE